jgi:Protein of unknown function (DUF3108)
MELFSNISQRSLLKNPSWTKILTVLFGISALCINERWIMPRQISSDSLANGQEKIDRVPCGSTVMCPGEDLVYEVSWWVFKLGQARLKTLDSKMVEGRLQHSAAAFIDSYEGLPFVDLHAIDYTDMDSALFSRGYRALEKKSGEWQLEQGKYDANQKSLIIERAMQKDLKSPPYTPSTFDTLRLDKAAFQDGLSILYYARGSARAVGDKAVLTVVYGKEGTTHFHFAQKRTTEDIEGVQGSVRAVELDGKAEFEGIYGLTGDFKGWFSDDAAAVPLKAEMKVILGSISIELKKWRRTGWEPPLAE